MNGQSALARNTCFPPESKQTTTTFALLPVSAMLLYLRGIAMTISGPPV